MNGMPAPLKGIDGHNSIFRLDLPNIQIASEELFQDMQQKNSKLYGVPLKDKFKNIDSRKKEGPSSAVKNLVPKFDEEPDQKLLGKRDKPEDQQEAKIVFD